MRVLKRACWKWALELSDMKGKKGNRRRGWLKLRNFDNERYVLDWSYDAKKRPLTVDDIGLEQLFHLGAIVGYFFSPNRFSTFHLG